MQYSSNRLRELGGTGHGGRLSNDTIETIHSLGIEKCNELNKGQKRIRRGRKSRHNKRYKYSHYEVRQSADFRNLKPIKLYNNKTWNSINFAVLNARSVRNKTVYLRDFILDNKLDIFCITESWLCESDITIPSEIAPDGFSFANFPRKQGKGGGILIIYRSSLKIKCNYEPVTNFEAVNCKLILNDRTIDLLVVYRPPPNTKNGYKNDIFLDEFSDLVTNSYSKASNFILSGDLNIHLDNEKVPLTKHFNNIIKSLGLVQWIKQPTHVAGHWLDV